MVGILRKIYKRAYEVLFYRNLVNVNIERKFFYGNVKATIGKILFH